MSWEVLNSDQGNNNSDECETGRGCSSLLFKMGFEVLCCGEWLKQILSTKYVWRGKERCANSRVRKLKKNEWGEPLGEDHSESRKKMSPISPNREVFLIEFYTESSESSESLNTLRR
jgi:hypothetical protein